MKKANLILLNRHLEKIRTLTDKEKVLILDAIISFQIDNEIINLEDRFLQFLFEEIINFVNENNALYLKQSIGGKKGAERRWGDKQTTVEQTPQKETNKFLNPLMPTPKQIRDPLKNPQPNNDYIETQEELVEEEKEPQETTINYKNLTIEEKEEIKEAREKQKLSNYKPTTPSFDKALKDLVDKANKMTT